MALAGRGARVVRDYSGTTLTLEPIPGARFLEDKWRWHVRIPAWMVDGGMKATGCQPHGTAMTRRGAIRAAERAVEMQRAYDQRQVTELRLSASGEGFIE